MKNLTLTFLIIILFSHLSFSQLDSVYYEGPSSGGVTSGAIQNTDFFSNELPFYGGDQFKIIPPIERIPDKRGDMIHGWSESQLPELVYVEDSNSNPVESGNGQHPVLLNSFNGIPMTNFIPPDAVIAAGPDHIIICANSLFYIMDKEGNILKNIPAAAWWAPAWPDESGDPQVIYDFFEQRWVLVWMQVNSGAQTAGNLIAYSDDDDPLGEWYMYRLDTKMHGTVASNTWGDYPHIGFDEEAIYIMTRCIDFAGAGHQYNKIRIINKTELYASNGNALTYNDIWDIRKPGEGVSGPVLDCIHPGVSYTAGSGAWFYWARGIYGGSPVSADFYAIYKLTNPLTSPGIKGKVLPVQTYTSPPLANQLGGGLGLETIGWITSRPIIRGGFLYAAHDIQNSQHPNYSSIKYMKIDLNTLTMVENIEYGMEGYFYLFPTLAIDKEHNVAITFSRSADTEYVGAYYSTRYANDPPGLNPSRPLAEGRGNYVVTYSGTINRWGDYFGIYLDPATDSDFWMISEYASFTNIWGTYVGRVRMVPFNGPYAFSNPDSVGFGNVEVGTTSDIISVILSNYGNIDLTITIIPTSVGDFKLISPPSVPYVLAPYDSLELNFAFEPTQAGNAMVNYPITTDDPNFTGYTLTGNGYDMNPAHPKTFYASSGAQNNGNILIINETTGAGTTVGLSLYPEIKSITIHPQTGIIYGLSAGSSSSGLVRINSGSGDAYLLHNINVPGLSCISFDNTETLYAVTNNGEIYTVNLNTGDANFIVDAEGSYSSIAFSPIANELWATSRSILPPNNDAIFKVSLSTGDTTIIGHTGLGKITNAIAFGLSENLFGVVGTSNELNDFISINTSTGAGTIIGSIGYKHILGLAFGDTDASFVDDKANNIIPDEYALYQNYPNPFNPSTKIKFSIPSVGKRDRVFVQLKVYDVLGNEVVTLVNQEKQAGSYEVELNNSGLPSGIYFYKLHAGSFTETKKMLLIK
jgi:hypothetical protein